jgi:hypothetical protein
MGVEDIEDIVVGPRVGGNNAVNDDDAAVVRVATRRRQIVPKFGPESKTNQAMLKNVAAHAEDPDGSFIPGRATVYVKTWGCSHNSSDAEYMAGQIVAAGYPITEDKV